MHAIERLVPVPPMSDAAFGVFSRIRYSGNPSRALFVAVRAGGIPPDDLPPIIADLWTRNDSPTADLSEEDWVEVFRAAGFFSYPPLVVRPVDSAPVPLQRPSRAVTLYRGSTTDRACRMSWACDPSVARVLGARHARYGSAALYKVTVVPSAILAYLERQAEGWTVVVDPAALTSVEFAGDL